MKSKGELIQCPACLTGRGGTFKYKYCGLCRGTGYLTPERHVAFTMLLPEGVQFWAGGGPILSVDQWIEILTKLKNVGIAP